MPLTSKQVIRRKEQLRIKSERLLKERLDLQEACPHHNLRYRNDGNGGGWDYEASYWRDWFCPDCEKRWVTDQGWDVNQPILKKYPHAIEVSKWHNSYAYDHFYDVDLVIVPAPKRRA